MDQKDVQELLRLLSKLEIAEFKYKDENVELAVKTKHFQAGQKGGVIQTPMPYVQAPAMPTPAPASTTVEPTPVAKSDSSILSSAPKEDTTQYLEVKSPMVGTFYRASGPEKAPFVKVGDSVSAGQVVCMIEAMKLFNEIESEVKGTIVKVMVEDAQPVEYDQVLFLIDPKG